MGFRTFVPLVAACPGCGRTTSTTFQELAQSIQNFIHDSMPEWKTRYPGVEGLNVAVMGCIVNGPGESKHADIGISLPGTGETPTAPVFIDGKKAATLRGPTVSADFQKMVIDYIERRYGNGGARDGRRRSSSCHGDDQATDTSRTIEIENSPVKAARPDRRRLAAEIGFADVGAALFAIFPSDLRR